MGKSCIRFKRVDDLALDLIGEAIRATPVDKHVEFYETVLKSMRKKTAKTKKKGPGAKVGKGSPKAKRAPKRATAKKRAAR
jgi:hypothetical protein